MRLEHQNEDINRIAEMKVNCNSFKRFFPKRQGQRLTPPVCETYDNTFLRHCTFLLVLLQFRCTHPD